jgi:hypothetical protein
VNSVDDLNDGVAICHIIASLICTNEEKKQMGKLIDLANPE